MSFPNVPTNINALQRRGAAPRWGAWVVLALLFACSSNKSSVDEADDDDSSSPTDAAAGGRAQHEPNPSADTSPDGGIDAGTAVPPDPRTLTFPRLLSQLGLFRNNDPSRLPSGGVRYEPEHPLWTNGSEKQRWILLPEGEHVTAAEDSFQFPEGTLLVKSFSYGDEPPIETRIMRLRNEIWEFAAYIWDDSGQDAELGDDFAATPVAVRVGGEEFQHSVPARLECKTCHEASPNPVLGFRSAQLRLELPRLTKKRVFAETPVVPQAISGATQLETRVLGYFLGNCRHCHNGWQDAAEPLFSLAAEEALKNLIGVATTGNGARGLRVSPGRPKESVLYQAISGQSDDPDLKTMPPLGVDVRDAAAIELIRTWIESLEPSD